jgi:hypothetical protein
MLTRIKDFGTRYGWGAIISAVPYVNGILVITAGVLCFLLYIFFNFFGVEPGTPSETMNPLG